MDVNQGLESVVSLENVKDFDTGFQILNDYVLKKFVIISKGSSYKTNNFLLEIVDCKDKPKLQSMCQLQHERIVVPDFFFIDGKIFVVYLRNGTVWNTLDLDTCLLSKYGSFKPAVHMQSDYAINLSNGIVLGKNDLNVLELRSLRKPSDAITLRLPHKRRHSFYADQSPRAMEYGGGFFIIELFGGKI